MRKSSVIFLSSLFIVSMCFHSFSLNNDVQDRTNIPPVVVLCIGDSITAASYPSLLQKKFDESGAPARVINAGMSGYTSGGYLRFINNFDLFKEIEPDIILLQLGTNDTRSAALAGVFQSDMARLINRIREDIYHAKPPVIFIASIPPLSSEFGWPKETQLRVERINSEIKELALKMSLHFVDNYSLFAENLEYLEDGVHPNERGYELLAENWFSSVTGYMDDKEECLTTALVYDEVFLSHNTGEGHPENPERLKAIINGLEEDNLISKLYLIKPSPADIEWITEVHALEYIDEVREAAGSGALYLHSPDTRISENSYSAALTAAGGVMNAIDAVMEGKVRNAFCAVRPPGHHASRDRAKGFCLFNNVAVGARYIQKKHNLPKVLIIDWDVHHGNGTQDIFYQDPDIFFFSVHLHPFYPGTGREQERGEGPGKGYNLNVPLPAGSGDKEYVDVFKEVLRPAALSFNPDFIIISAGFDAHKSDPLGGMRLTSGVFAALTQVVKDIAEQTCKGRIVSVLEGGYDHQALSESVSAHISALIKDDSL